MENNSNDKKQNTVAARYCYRYPHPAMTCDCVIFGFDGRDLKILLIERGLEPCKGMWALPGGFMHIDETIEQCAARELREETGLENIYMEQFKVFSNVDRDPRERVVTVAFIALIRPNEYRLIAGDDAANALWFPVDSIPPMAFDHADILRQAREHLGETLKIKPIAFQLLNTVFSLADLQRVYEAITGLKYDRRNFQRKAMSSGMLEQTDLVDDDIFAHFSGPVKHSLPSISHFSHESDRPAMRKASASERRLPRLFRFTSPKRKDKEDGSTKDLFDF